MPDERKKDFPEKGEVHKITLGLFLTGEEFPLEKKKVGGAAGDATVREIEDRTEKDNLLAASNQREKEHIDHLAEHKRCIVPDKTVEKAVYDIAYGAGGNHGQPHKRTYGSVSPAVEFTNPPDQESAEQQPESRKEKLADSSAETHSKSHSFVLDETQPAPIPDKKNLLAKTHIGLDQHLYQLVNSN